MPAPPERDLKGAAPAVPQALKAIDRISPAWMAC
jgi:hypothetical protein